MVFRKGFTVLKRHSSTLALENGKQWAGVNAIEDLIQSNPSVIGLGSSSTMVYAIEHLARTRLAKTVTCIPTSFQTRQLIISHKLKLGSLDQFPVVDVTVDSADEIDSNLNAIKGSGGYILQDRLLAQSSRRFILVADTKRKSLQLGTQWRRGVPIEVIPIALASVGLSLERMFPSAQMRLRMATPSNKAGPVVTDNGNLIIDCNFGPIEQNPAELYKEIKCLSGVLDVGLFCNMAESAYIGDLEGDKGEIIYRKK
ncbi:ribose-5-phosphate isomerase [Thamnidium elegans]|uniref:Ribose-5-phosphate isomerase n=1 Tax=Thamnidium elegans TaxID=101142 RepID=A0A8H7SH54_9FUNG|nr:hypothetical protein INT48_002749 [Thamnidium elegans]KAI8087085.1 ribose-5-phosphate isomerase [Thamnidium elegans]